MDKIGDVLPDNITAEEFLSIIEIRYLWNIDEEIPEGSRIQPERWEDSKQLLQEVGLISGDDSMLTQEGREIGSALHNGVEELAKERLKRQFLGSNLFMPLWDFTNNTDLDSKSDLHAKLVEKSKEISKQSAELLVNLLFWCGSLGFSDGSIKVDISVLETSEESISQPPFIDSNNANQFRSNSSSQNAGTGSASSVSLDTIRVKNYKNIEDTGKISLPNITALLGKNESGKTSILEAIEFLSNPEIPSEAIPNNLSKPESEAILIQAEFSLDNEVAEEIYDTNKIDSLQFPLEFEMTRYVDGSRSISSELIESKPVERIIEIATEVSKSREQLKGILRSKTLNSTEKKIVERFFELRSYGTELPDSATASEVLDITDEIIELSARISTEETSFEEVLGGLKEYREKAGTGIDAPEPVVLYFDTFDMISDSYNFQEPAQERNNSFGYLLDIGGFSHDEFKNANSKPIYLDRVARNVTRKLSECWSQKQIEVRLQNPDDNILSLYIRDETASDESPVSRDLTRPSQRSEGFRWFLSFFVDAISASDEDTTGHRIFLFDDPAVYLHPEGKRDWLHTVEDYVGDTEQVVYTAHSPYLIDKRYPNRIRIVEDSCDGTIMHSDIFDSDSDPDSLEPLRNALGINLGDSPFLSARTLLVEGPSDYYYFTGVINYFEKYEDREILDIGKISINPTNGASEMPKRASWLSSQGINFAMVFDSDDGGNSPYRKIEQNKYIGVDISDAVKLKSSTAESGLTIEDMFPLPYFLKSFNTVYKKKARENDINYQLIDQEETENGYLVGIRTPDQSDWEHGPTEYDGYGITDILEELLDEQEIDDKVRDDNRDVRLFKRDIAEHIHNRLEQGDSPEDNLHSFNRILGEIETAFDST